MYVYSIEKNIKHNFHKSIIFNKTIKTKHRKSQWKKREIHRKSHSSGGVGGRKEKAAGGGGGKWNFHSVMASSHELYRVNLLLKIICLCFSSILFLIHFLVHFLLLKNKKLLYWSERDGKIIILLLLFAILALKKCAKGNIKKKVNMTLMLFNAFFLKGKPDFLDLVAEVNF